MTAIDLKRTFARKRVFVTGHTGFMGSWLALWLSELGAKVTGYALAPPTDPSHFAAARIRDVLAGHHENDIRDAVALEAAMRAAAPDVVFHLAAQALVRQGYLTPRETFDVNVIGVAGVLDAVRSLDKPCTVIVITSDKCYENREQVWGYRETDSMGGHDPYSASKGAAELLIASYRRSFFPTEELPRHGVKLASARAGNVIGGGDWAKDRIMTDTVRSLAAGKRVPVRSPLSVRPWQHVLEPISGYLYLAGCMLASDEGRWCTGWNFGPVPGQHAAVGELVSRFCQAWGGGKWKDVSDPKQPHEAGVLRLCIDKAVWDLSWRPRWSLSQTIQRTALWYRRFYEDPAADMRAASLADIQTYSQSVPE